MMILIHSAINDIVLHFLLLPLTRLHSTCAVRLQFVATWKAGSSSVSNTPSYDCLYHTVLYSHILAGPCAVVNVMEWPRFTHCCAAVVVWWLWQHHLVPKQRCDKRTFRRHLFWLVRRTRAYATDIISRLIAPLLSKNVCYDSYIDTRVGTYELWFKLP